MPEKISHDGLEDKDAVLDQLEKEFLKKLSEFTAKAKECMRRGGPQGAEVFEKALSFLTQPIPPHPNTFAPASAAPAGETS
ncbi:hypothetical protein RRG08_019669 [Elysia crispata]|uniref:Uncharacterized protein n=1 Tax=Elysia crispata TaxID=231223 RepID=A0AAE1D5U8_9GAST|nr:hypothetical protein RRG08_019669 [Elysia crispata]